MAGKDPRIEGRAAMALPFCLIQDELETVPLCPNLSISGRNMHRMRTGGKSIVQLETKALRRIW
jgi:hypothetical protein